MGKRIQKRREARTNGGFALWCVLILLLLCALGLTALASGGSDSFDAAQTFAPQGGVRISEVMTSNASTLSLSDGSWPDWIELHNAGEKAVSLSGWSLMPESEPKKLYCFSSDAMIHAGGYLVVYCDGGRSVGGELHARFSLAASGAAVTLLDASGQRVDRVVTPELGRDEAYCRDAMDEWQMTRTPTPGEANRIAEREEVTALAAQDEAAAGEVEITEVMTRNVTYCPDAQGRAHDWVELHNASNAPVSLSGWSLSDDAQKRGKWTFPDATIPAGGYLIVYCSGTSGDASELHASFRLSGEGTQVILTRADGQTASMADVPALEKDQSWSKQGGGWTKALSPTPGQSNDFSGAVAIDAELRANSAANVILSEIAASSSTVGTDWIELYNAGTEAVDLSGWGLSDSAGRPRKWQFPSGTTIAPGQYLGVLLTDKQVSGQLCADFRLSLEGGYTVTLSRADGTLVDRAWLPEQYADLTYGRVEGRSGFYYFDVPTPQAANTSTAYTGRASAPEYSTEGGMFRTGDALTVTLSAPAGARVYYTTDCSDPDESATLYTGPISISQTTVLRTRVYGDGLLPSFIDSQSYLYDVNNGNGVYVVSVVSDPDNLVSDEKGIMVKGPNALAQYPYGSMNVGANFWMDWEREGHVEIFGGDGENLLSQGCGIKLHGQYSRAEKQQAFKIIARSKYGGNRFPIKLFSNRDYTEYQSFLLRSSGQDTDKTRMRDSVLTALAKDTSVMYQESEVCVMYLNGQYWGQYNLRERINDVSICQFEGWEGQEDDIDIVKANSNVMQGSNDTFAALLSWVKSTDPTASDFYEKLSSAIDVRNYIEYMAVEIFSGNTDTLNVKRYRNANADGRWRWVLFDLDWAFTTDTNSINRWVTPGGMGNGLRTDNTLFVACMKNAQFRDEFLTYFGQQLATTFSTENVLARMQERYQILDPLLDDQFAKWGQSRSNYESAMKVMIQYAQQRPTKIIQYFSGRGVSGSKISMTDEQLQHYFGDAIAKIQSAGS